MHGLKIMTVGLSFSLGMMITDVVFIPIEVNSVDKHNLKHTKEKKEMLCYCYLWDV